MNKTLFKEFLEDIPEIDTQKEVLVITDMDFFDYIRSHRKEVQDEYQDEDIDEFFQILLEEDVPDFDNYNIRIETQLREDLHRAVLKKPVCLLWFNCLLKHGSMITIILIYF